MPVAKASKHARSQPADTNHRYANDPTLLPTADPERYAILRAHYQSAWAPVNQYIADKVDDLVAARWEINRLRAVRRQFLNNVFHDIATTYNPRTADLSVLAETEVRASANPGTLDRLDLRLRRCSQDISRLERDIARLTRYFANNGGSQMSLQTKDQEPEEDPADWARRTCRITPDAHQTGVLMAASHTTVLAGGPSAGKTTALALRALHEAERNPGAVVACVSPSGALLAKVEQLAGSLPGNISGEITAATTLVLLDDAGSLTTPPAIPARARVILAGTPAIAEGYFYEQWMSPHTAKLIAPARRENGVNPPIYL